MELYLLAFALNQKINYLLANLLRKMNFPTHFAFGLRIHQVVTRFFSFKSCKILDTYSFQDRVMILLCYS